jgi:hypothetical protein
MEKFLTNTESSEQKKEKNSVWYNIFHWALLFYFFAAVIAIFYGGYLFVDYIVTTIKNWV